MNLYCINLVTYFNFYECLDRPKSVPSTVLSVPKSLEKVKSLIKDQNNKFILSVLWEIWPHEKVLAALELLGVTPNQSNVVLILDVYSYRNPDHWKTVNVILYDSLLLKVYESENPTKVNTLEHDKLLYMLGKPHKKQRILALYELYQRNKLDKCDWSMHYGPHLEDVVRCNLPEMNDDEYKKFIASAVRKLDDISPQFEGNTTNFYRVCFNPTSHFYEQTSVTFLPETSFCPDVQFITEKTWRAVNNFHPFVLIDYKNTYEYLHSLGIDTFQYAVKHPYKSLVGTEEEVINMCVDNVLYLLENKNRYKDKLTESIINNKQVFENLATTYSSRLHPGIEKAIWCLFQKIRNGISEEVYEALWTKNGY